MAKIDVYQGGLKRAWRRDRYNMFNVYLSFLHPSCHLGYIVNFLLLICKVRSHVTARSRHNTATLEIVNTWCATVSFFRFSLILIKSRYPLWHRTSVKTYGLSHSRVSFSDRDAMASFFGRGSKQYHIDRTLNKHVNVLGVFCQLARLPNVMPDWAHLSRPSVENKQMAPYL